MSKLKSVQAFTELNEENPYLILISPERIPHLMVYSKGKYYSLTNRKSVIDEDFVPYFKFLKKSNRSVLFVELEASIQDLVSYFESHSKVNSVDTTCLKPIKDWLKADNSVDFVFDLIRLLNERNQIKGSSHINMEDYLDNLGDFKLSTYSKEDIYSYIDRLNKKYV